VLAAIVSLVLGRGLWFVQSRREDASASAPASASASGEVAEAEPDAKEAVTPPAGG
jgi:hypothetical protein